MFITTDAMSPPINNYYKTSNSWKCPRCKKIVGFVHAALDGVTGGTSRGRDRISTNYC